MIQIIMLAIFSKIPDRDCRSINVDVGQRVFRQGDPVFGVGYLHQGAVDLVRHTESGLAVKISSARSDDTFAEASVFSSEYHCDCIATVTAKVTLFRASAILHLLKSDPDFAFTFTEQLVKLVQRGRRQKEILAIKSAQDRVLYALADGWLSGTVMSFASAIGLSHEAVYRALRDLQAKGKIEKLDRGRYRVLVSSSAA